jgi:predicted nucleic acid-binding Zn ribbon protein
MANRSKGPEHIKHLLGQFIRKHDLRGKMGTREIYAIWPEVVGPDIASHTRITAFRKGVLSVAVDSAAHFYELSTFFGEEIRAKLNQRGLKKFVTKVNFHLD